MGGGRGCEGGKSIGRVCAKAALVDGGVQVAWPAAALVAEVFAVREARGAARGAAGEYGPDEELGGGGDALDGEVVACGVVSVGEGCER